MQANNIINCKSSKKEIMKSINFSQNNKSFKNSLKKCKNPYGDGKSSERIVKILKKINLSKILDKKITY